MPDARFFGRAFEAQGQIILPCPACGTPLWPGTHVKCKTYDALVLMTDTADILEQAWEALG